MYQRLFTGDIGVSPISSMAITGFGLVMDAMNAFSTSDQVIGKVYASDYAGLTASNLTTAGNDMRTAYIDAAGRAADYTKLYTGDISGRTLTPGVYKWGTGVLINSDVTLNGGPNDVFISPIAKGIAQAPNTNIILTGGVQAKNIFWQSAQTVAIQTQAHFEGIILGGTKINSHSVFDISPYIKWGNTARSLQKGKDAIDKGVHLAIINYKKHATSVYEYRQNLFGMQQGRVK